MKRPHRLKKSTRGSSQIDGGRAAAVEERVSQRRSFQREIRSYIQGRSKLEKGMGPRARLGILTFTPLEPRRFLKLIDREALERTLLVADDCRPWISVGELRAILEMPDSFSARVELKNAVKYQYLVFPCGTVTEEESRSFVSECFARYSGVDLVSLLEMFAAMEAVPVFEMGQCFRIAPGFQGKSSRTAR